MTINDAKGGSIVLRFAACAQKERASLPEGPFEETRRNANWNAYLSDPFIEFRDFGSLFQSLYPVGESLSSLCGQGCPDPLGLRGTVRTDGHCPPKNSVFSVEEEKHGPIKPESFTERNGRQDGMENSIEVR